MKQTAKLLSLLMVLFLLLAMTACGGKAPASGTPGDSTEVSLAEPAEETAEVPDEATAVPDAVEASDAEEVSAEDETVGAPEDSEEPEIVIEYPLFDTPQTYTIWFSNSPDLSDIINSMDEYLVFRELEKITNVTWDPTMVSFFSSSEQFSLMVASEDYTDVVVRAVDSYSGSVDQAIEEEFLIDLSELIDENMPNLVKWFNTYPILRKQITSDEGNIAGFPKIYKEPSDVTEGAMIRQDWLDDLGLENPKTYEELQAVLEAFRDEKGASAPLVIPSSTGVQSDFLILEGEDSLILSGHSTNNAHVEAFRIGNSFEVIGRHLNKQVAHGISVQVFQAELLDEGDSETVAESHLGSSGQNAVAVKCISGADLSFAHQGSDKIIHVHDIVVNRDVKFIFFDPELDKDISLSLELGSDDLLCLCDIDRERNKRRRNIDIEAFLTEGSGHGVLAADTGQTIADLGVIGT